MDCLDKPKYCGGIIEVAKAFREELDTEKLREYALRMNNSDTIRRLGHLCDYFGVDIDLPKPKTRNYILLDPTMLREGNVDSKWRVTAVGPTIIPWECRGRTFERLITAPVSLTTVLLGDFQASLYFGLGVSLAVSVPAVLYLGINPSLPVFIGATLLALACFSAMTILMSSYPPKDVPADVMMLSSLVKFSLLFISGIFVPIERLPSYGRALSFVSPLTYYVDAVRHSLGGGYLPVWLDLVMLAIFAVAFFMAGAWVHEKVLERRFT
ncbi:hypothetical protein J2747_000937 [Thermococcus stetteri]|nr:hypothetical protein [Thermococcus stetteri]